MSGISSARDMLVSEKPRAEGSCALGGSSPELLQLAADPLNDSTQSPTRTCSTAIVEDERDAARMLSIRLGLVQMGGQPRAAGYRAIEKRLAGSEAYELATRNFRAI